MRGFLFLITAVMMAQTPAPKAAQTKAAAAKPKTAVAATAARPKAAGATATAATKPALTKRAAVKPKPAVPAPLATDEEKIAYSLGLSIHRSLLRFDMTAEEIAILKRGIDDAAAGKPALKLDEWGPKIESLAQARAARIAAREKVASEAYLAKAAAEPGAVKAPSGLIYRELKAGTGASPKDTDTVKVHYRGTFTNGTEFDSSYRRNEPAQFPLKGVIPCWTEGVQKMKVGGKSVLVCPSALAYGDKGRGPIPGGAALTFEVELVEIMIVAK
jgi:FKBP-type peptidyl-prolyl cis-trans isomerase FkpA